jgi:hypothetical protein
MALTPEQQAALDRARTKKRRQEVLERVRKPQSGMDQANAAILEVPGMRAANELASGVNRSMMGMVDFVATDPLNAILGLGGINSLIPRASDTAAASGVGTRDPQSGMMGEVAGTVGEVIPAAVMGGQLLRSGAQMLSPLAAQSESAAAGMLRSAGTSTPAADIGYGAAAGAGAEGGEQVGGDTGALIGGFFGGLGAAGGVSVFKKLLSSPAELTALTQSLSSMSDEGAARLLADAMVRENISPDDAMRQLQALGPEAIPADVSNSFARLLRTATNQTPRLQGRANTVLNERQSGQADRLASSLDDSLGVPGLNMQDEIERLRTVTQPVINQLYEQARGTPMALSKSLRTMLTGKNSLGDAFKLAQRRVADKRAVGDQITNFDLIDATKQQLDDQIGVAIRAGENNRARDLVRLKNAMMAEADASVPGYREARNAFAGRAALENAADQGTLFFKMPAREVEDLVSTMGESELRMFRLGAKQAILDKVDSLPVGADGARRLFGRNGDVEKLRALFPSQGDIPGAEFEQFRQSLEREATFTMTRRAAQGNSTTAMQLADMGSAEQVMNSVRAIAGDPIAATQEAARVFRGLSSKKGEQAYKAALERAGDILLNAGTDPQSLQRLLLRGDTPRLRMMLQDALAQPRPEGVRGVQSGIVSEVAP